MNIDRLNPARGWSGLANPFYVASKSNVATGFRFGQVPQLKTRGPFPPRKIDRLLELHFKKVLHYFSAEIIPIQNSLDICSILMIVPISVTFNRLDYNSHHCPNETSNNCLGEARNIPLLACNGNIYVYPISRSLE